MKKLLISAYSLQFGGIEKALMTLLKEISPQYEITLVLEKKEGMFLNQIPENIKVMEYKPNSHSSKLFRKAYNFIKQQKFKIIYKNKFDVSICFATYSYPAAFVARNASKNSILWVHNDYMNFYKNDKSKYKEFFEKLQIDKYKKIVFVSENDKKVFLKEFPLCESKIYVCNNLIDYKKIEAQANEIAPDFEQKENVVTFINLGRHDEVQKKLSRIISSTKRLNQEGYIFRVIFVGEGQDTQQLKEQAKGISNIEFLGPKKNPYPYLKKSDCLIMSSDFEGYPVVFIESLILGKPIITTDVSDAKYELEGKYAIVVEKSEEGIYNGMKQFLEKGFSMDKFCPEEYNKKILAKLKEII